MSEHQEHSNKVARAVAITSHQGDAIREWLETAGISDEELTEAVRNVGRSFLDVRRYLQHRKSRKARHVSDAKEARLQTQGATCAMPPAAKEHDGAVSPCVFCKQSLYRSNPGANGGRTLLMPHPKLETRGGAVYGVPAMRGQEHVRGPVAYFRAAG